MFFGTLSILSGDLTGAISVAGGTAANIANSDHPSSISRWIVNAPQEDFDSQSDFQRYALETIVQANIESISEITGKSTELVLINEVKVYFYAVDGVKLGWAYNLDMEDLSRDWVGQRKDYLNNEIYTYGYERLAMGVSPFVYLKSNFNSDYSDYLKLVTSKLPEGFYFYSTSLPKAWGQDNKLYHVSEAAPAIYTQGKRYEFIKPQVKQ